MIRQLDLDLLPGGIINDCLMKPFVQLFLVTDLADVDRVAQNAVERAAREGCATANVSMSIGSLFADDAQRMKPNAKLPYRTL